MKYIISIIIVAFSFTASAQKYKYEEDVLQNFYDSLPDNGAVFKTEFLKFEDYLIQNNIIGKGSGKDYLSLFINLSSVESLKFIEYKFLDSLEKHKGTGIYDSYELLGRLTNKSFDSYENSRTSQIEKDVDAQTLSSHADNIDESYDFLRKVLKPKDFNQEYFKVITLYSIGVMLQLEDLVADMDLGLPEQNVETEGLIGDPIEQNACMIYINYADSILFENVIVPLDSITSLVKKQIQYTGTDLAYPLRELKHIPLLGEISVSQVVVCLVYDRATTYKTYLAVQNAVVAAFTEAKNECAIKHFGKPYIELTVAQQNAVKSAIPQRISEAEPKLGRE